MKINPPTHFRAGQRVRLISRYHDPRPVLVECHNSAGVFLQEYRNGDDHWNSEDLEVFDEARDGQGRLELARKMRRKIPEGAQVEWYGFGRWHRVKEELVTYGDAHRWHRDNVWGYSFRIIQELHQEDPL